MRRLIALAVITAVAAGGCAGESRIRKISPHRTEKIYVVKSGENLSDVAKKFGTDVASIKRANKLELGRVTEGQRLIIPRRGSRAVSKAAISKQPVRPKKRKKAGSAKLRPPSKAPKIDMTLDWPLKKGQITSNFGIRKNGKHDGLDLAAPKGTKIYSAAGGKVIFSGWGPTGYGKLVVIKHSDRLFTVYAHNSENLVKKGDTVSRGDAIALVGKTGRATNDHLHFEVRVDRVAYDPLKYLDSTRPTALR